MPILWDALISDDPGDLKQAIDVIEKQTNWPQDIQDDLKTLYEYRRSYEEDLDLPFQERRNLREREWNLTIELALRLWGHAPAGLIGQMPIPDRLRHLVAEREMAEREMVAPEPEAEPPEAEVQAPEPAAEEPKPVPPHEIAVAEPEPELEPE